MSIETDTLPATAGAWTPSASVKILSASAESMNEGDLVQVYGSSLGTEPSATDGTLVGTVVKTPFGIVFSPVPQFWKAYPFLRASSPSGANDAVILVNGSTGGGAGPTPGLASDESIDLNLSLQDGYAYVFTYEAIAEGPAPTEDPVSGVQAAAFILNYSTPSGLAFLQEAGNIAKLVGGFPPPKETPLYNPPSPATKWILAAPVIQGPPGAQFLQWVFTDFGTEAVVKIALQVRGTKVAHA